MGKRNRPPKEYVIGDKTFHGAKEGARFIGFSTRTFLNRYKDYREGYISAQEALATERKPIDVRNTGNEEWQSLSCRVRTENLCSIPEPTEYERGDNL